MVDPLRTRATWLVGRAHLRGHGLLQEAFAAAGARPYHYRLLAALAETEPISQAELGRMTGIDRSDVATSLETLSNVGFVVRRVDPADRRRNVVSPTAAGRAELLRLDAVVAEVQDRFLEPLTVAERAVFLDLVARLGPDAEHSRDGS